MQRLFDKLPGMGRRRAKEDNTPVLEPVGVHESVAGKSEQELREIGRKLLDVEMAANEVLASAQAYMPILTGIRQLDAEVAPGSDESEDAQEKRGQIDQIGEQLTPLLMEGLSVVVQNLVDCCQEYQSSMVGDNQSLDDPLIDISQQIFDLVNSPSSDSILWDFQLTDSPGLINLVKAAAEQAEAHKWAIYREAHPVEEHRQQVLLQIFDQEWGKDLSLPGYDREKVAEITQTFQEIDTLVTEIMKKHYPDGSTGELKTLMGVSFILQWLRVRTAQMFGELRSNNGHGLNGASSILRETMTSVTMLPFDGIREMVPKLNGSTSDEEKKIFLQYLNHYQEMCQKISLDEDSLRELMGSLASLRLLVYKCYQMLPQNFGIDSIPEKLSKQEDQAIDIATRYEMETKGNEKRAMQDFFKSLHDEAESAENVEEVA